MENNKKLMKLDNYDELIKKEAAFWGKECSRPRGVCDNPIYMWDDAQVESIMRGEYLHFMVQKAAEKPGNRVLELGCGHGWLSLEIAKKGIAVDGFDISSELIEEAKKRTVDFNGTKGFRPPNYEVRDLNRITFEPEYYDVVVVWDALHHILEIERLLNEVKKGLKHGGTFVLIDHVREPTVPGKIISKLITLILPTDIPKIILLKIFYHKIKVFIKKNIFFYKIDPSDEPPIEQSPFEDITGIEMVDMIENLFTIHRKKFILSFSHMFVARIRTWDSLRLVLVRMFKKFDDFIIRLGLLKGEYVFLWAVKSGK